MISREKSSKSSLSTIQLNSAPEFVYFGKDFSFSYSGAPVTRVSILAPGSGTHGTELNQVSV